MSAENDEAPETSSDDESPVAPNMLSVHLDMNLDTGQLRIQAPADPLRSCGLMQLAQFQILYANVASAGVPSGSELKVDMSDLPPGLGRKLGLVKP